MRATARPRIGDAAHIRTFRRVSDAQARAGLLLHGGNRLDRIPPDVLFVPW